MATANLNNEKLQVIDGNDNIVIANVTHAIRGGRTLDVTGVTDAYLKSGHVIIKETATGDYKPMPVTEGAYASLPEGHTYVGVLIASIPTNKPFAGIMYGGTVNPTASPFALTSILTALKTALPLMDFRGDE